MKDKIIARLKALFPGVNLSKTRIDGICNPDKLKITEETEETEIDQKLKDLNDILDFAAIAKSDDKLRNFESKDKQQKKEESSKDSNDTKDQDQEKQSGSSSPDIEQILQKALSPLMEKIATLEKGKTTESRSTALQEAIKDFPDAYKTTVTKGFSRSNFESDEDFNAYVEEVKADGAAFVQSLSDQGLGQSKAPFQPAGTGSTQSALKSDIEAWAKANAPAEPAK